MTCHPDCWFCWEEIDHILQLTGWVLFAVHIILAVWGAHWWQRRLQVDHSANDTRRSTRLFGEVNTEALLLATAILFFLFNQQTFGHSLHQQLTARIEHCKKNTARQDCALLSDRQPKKGDDRSARLSPLVTATAQRVRGHRPVLDRLLLTPGADARRSAGTE